jgi:putative ATP-dependent endonuclease of OLD family
VFSLQAASHFLFSEKVLLVEGKTEMMLIPTIYQIVHGRSYAHSKGCLISGSSSSSLLPMIHILRNVGYAPKALADLDFAFKVAVHKGLIAVLDPDIVACKNWFLANAAVLDVHLDGNGLPQRRGPGGVRSALQPADAYERLALAMPIEIGRIVATLQAQDIWIWQNGAIEAHLGIGKNDTDRINFVTTARHNKNLNHATSQQALHGLAHWM